MLVAKEIDTTKTIQLNVRVTEETRTSLVELAERLNMTMAEVITELVAQEWHEQFYSQ